MTVPLDLPSVLVDRLEHVRPARLVEASERILGEAFGVTRAELLLLDLSDSLLTPYGEGKAPPRRLEGEAAACLRSGLPRSTREGLLVPVTFRGGVLGLLVLQGGEERVLPIASALGAVVGAATFGSSRHSDVMVLSRRGHRLGLAATMQHDLLPLPEYADDVVEISGAIEPAYDVAGDAFDYATNHGSVELAVFDGVGHGVRASILGSLALAAHRWARRQEAELASVYRRASEVIEEEGETGEFVTACLCRLDLGSGRLTLVNAGHPLPMVHRSTHGTVDTLHPPAALPLGLGGSAESVEWELSPGDTLLLHTDGVVEAADPSGRRWETERLERGLREAMEREDRLRWVLRSLLDDVVRFVTGELTDDATLLALRWSPSG